MTHNSDSNPGDDGPPDPVRAVVRLALERDFPSVDHEDIVVEECPFESCNTRFLGANLEDYGVHLVKEHRLYRRSQSKLYQALAQQSKRSESRKTLGSETT